MKQINNVVTFLKDYWIINLFIFVYIPLHKFFEELISIYIVDAVFSYFEKSWLTDLIFCVAVIILLLIFVLNFVTKKYISNWRNNTAIIILLICGYYRFLNPIWNYIEVYNIHAIKYIDIIFIFCLCTILSKISYRKQELKVEANKGLICDNAITRSDEDKLGRNDIAKDLAEKISNTKASKGSLAFGIVAPWGYGKTSFLNLLVVHLAKYNSEIIWFNPWRFEKEKSLTLAFFNELSLVLKKYNSELATDILNYAQILSPIDNTAIKVLNKIIESSSQNDFQSRFASIDKTIQNIGKHIVVIVDDIDRLDHNEIAEILKLIRNSANFTNIIFIGAYDRNYLIKALQKINPYQNSVFLEKIFQFEFTLPDFDTDVLKKQVFTLIKEFTDSDESDILEKAIIDNRFLNIYTGFIDSPITNMRDVKRYVNSFKVAYERLKGEVDLVDLMNVELLKLKFPTIYDLLVAKWNIFLTSKNYYTHQLMLWSQNQRVADTTFTPQKEDFKKYIDTNYKELGIKKTDFDILFQIIDTLFPEYGSVNADMKKINNEFSIRRYFFYSLLDSDLSESEFDNLWSPSFEDIKSTIDQLIVSKSRSLVVQISKRTPKSLEEYKKIVRSIFYIGSISKSWVNDSNEVTRFLSMNSYFDSDTEYKNFILEVFNENKTNEYCLKYLQSLYDRIAFDFNFITKDDNIQLNLDFYSDLILSGASIKLCLYNLYFTTYIDWVEVGGGHWNPVTVRNKKADQLFVKYARANPVELFHYLIRRSIDASDKFMIYDYVQTIWGSWENFEQFIYNISVESNEIDEFIRFMELCKEKDYKEYVEFRFNYLSLS